MNISLKNLLYFPKIFIIADNLSPSFYYLEVMNYISSRSAIVPHSLRPEPVFPLKQAMTERGGAAPVRIFSYAAAVRPGLHLPERKKRLPKTPR